MVNHFTLKIRRSISFHLELISMKFHVSVKAFLETFKYFRDLLYIRIP